MDKRIGVLIGIVALGVASYYLSKYQQPIPQQVITQKSVEPRQYYIVVIHNNICPSILVGISFTSPNGVQQFLYLHGKTIIYVRPNDMITFHFYGYRVNEKKTVRITSDIIIYVGQKTPWKPKQPCSTELITEQAGLIKV